MYSPEHSSVGDHSATLERQPSVPSVAKLTSVEIPLEERQLRMRSHQRVGSEPLLSPVPLSAIQANGLFHVAGNSELGSAQSALTGSDGDLTRPAPPKPSRLPTIKIRRSQAEKKPVVVIRNAALYEDDGKDYSDYDQVKSWPEKLATSPESLPPSRMTEALCERKLSAMSQSLTNNVPSALKCIRMVDDDILSRSQFDMVVDHDSRFLTPDNRPLESSAVSVMKSLILDSSPALIARHVTLIDVDIFRVCSEHDVGFGVVSGLELMTLPQGRWLRQDVIERYHCLRLFVSVLILRSSNRLELTRMLHQWIQTASELRSTSVGNLFSFSAIMHALLSAPISRLTLSWLQLRQQFNVSSVTFETKLCSVQRSLDTASGTLPLHGVTVPHMLPLAEMLESPCDDGGCAGLKYDLDTILAHLDMARVISTECRLYRSTVATLLSSGGAADLALLDLLGTPTHMRLLWGARGVGVERSERIAKFEQVLNVLSEKVEPRESCL
jgi:hypothetical protein